MNIQIIRIPIGTLKTALSTDHLDTLTLVRPNQFIRCALSPPASPSFLFLLPLSMSTFLHQNQGQLEILVI
jgi:hypothetical protein